MKIFFSKEYFGKISASVVLKFCSSIMAIYLIIKEVQNYTIVKPTSTEKTTKTMSQEFIPEMLFCPKPGFRLDIVNELGYEGILSLVFYIYVCIYN